MGSGFQYFGTIETAHGVASALLCVDDDSPADLMIQWGGVAPIVAGGVLTRGQWNGDVLEVAPRIVYSVNEAGGLFAPLQLTPEQLRWRDASRGALHKTPRGLEGNWTDPDGVRRDMSFLKPTEPPERVAARQCRGWGCFKTWANEITASNNASMFRGHGSKSFSLKTSLNRAGRYRLERYLAIELQAFKNHAEAVLNRRFNTNDPYEYATLAALAQHHGLPTPMLDWTESPYIAAFFALSAALENQRAGGKSTHIRVCGLTEKFVQSTSPPLVSFAWPLPFVASFAVAPIHNQRMYAQQGKFLVTNVADVEAFIRDVETRASEQHLFAVDVPVSCASEALQDLAFMGLTGATMFPGLDGVTRMLRHEMFYKKPP